MRNHFETRIINVSFVSFRMQFPYFNRQKILWSWEHASIHQNGRAATNKSKKSLKTYDFIFFPWYGFYVCHTQF